MKKVLDDALKSLGSRTSLTAKEEDEDKSSSTPEEVESEYE